MNLEDLNTRNFSICQLIKEFDLIEGVLADCESWDIDKLSYNVYVKEIKQASKKELKNKQRLGYDEEQRLIDCAEKGDVHAVKQLVLANLGLVIHEARKFQNLGVSLNDLISEGNFGLFKAVNNVENRGFRFATYAKLYIRNSIISAIVKYGTTIRYSSAIWIEYNKICKIRSKYYAEHGYIPTDGEVAEFLNIPESRVSEILSAIESEISIDAFSDLCGNYDKSDVLLNYVMSELPLFYIDSYKHQIDDVFFMKSLAIDIEGVLGLLYEREREILKMFYGIGCEEMDLGEIAEKFNLTRERVRQIKEKAIRKLKGQKNVTLKRYLG